MIDRITAEVVRLIMGFVFLGLLVFFYKRYSRSKKEGFENPFFIGLIVLFAVLFLFHLFYAIYNILIAADIIDVVLTAKFSWLDEERILIDAFSNQYRPLFLIFYSLMNVIIAAQVHSLERIIKWEKHPVSIFMLIMAGLLWLNFIPAIVYSFASILIISLAFISIGTGFLLNIGINFWLASKTPGQVRRRSLFAAAAFIFTALGLVWSMEMRLGRMLHDSISNEIDVLIGCAIELIGCVCYFKGFATTGE